MNDLTTYTGLMTSVTDQPQSAPSWPAFTNRPTPDERSQLRYKLANLTMAVDVFIETFTEPTRVSSPAGEVLDRRFSDDGYPGVMIAHVVYHFVRMRRAWEGERFNDLVLHMRKLDAALREVVYSPKEMIVLDLRV